ncbi:DNA polymerase IV [Bifidobacterium margollesii]|uniref:DNA polymerase IV n=1 Tax=Bifidobacterium margollesii TaxID=2020964 RepID=A0A2N5JCY2_9BIFI|nr:DNA polymerase IV [Bifidobacterium margollesii]PLS32049.1 DNA polymerase IV [Bifidobacterium margollesii]
MSTSPRSAAVRRDWGHDETGCTTLHIDMDAFFASCEIARRPELKGRPVIIGTGPRSVVSAASYEARPYGVNSAMPVATARRLCPDGVFLPVDMTYYRSISHRIFQLMSRITDRIERTSVDEVYMDVSGALRQWERPTAIGAWIRREVERRFHVTCSVGVAGNKLVAKLASTNAKPNGMLLVPVARQAEFVQMLPLRSLPGVGPSSAKRLEQWGVTTVTQLATMSRDDLTRATGSAIHANGLYLAARGIDERAVVPYTPEKSIGAERTFDEDTQDPNTVTGLLLWCADTVASSLRRRGLLARTITVKLRFADLRYSTKSQTLDRPVNTAAAIYPQSVMLLERMLDMPAGAISRGMSLPRPVRLAGVSASGLSDTSTTPVQASFDDLLAEEPSDRNTIDANGGSCAGTAKTVKRMGQAEKALDSIRERFGRDAVRLGLRDS